MIPCLVLLAACGGSPKTTRILYKPYKIAGKQYVPLEPGNATGFAEEGIASWYTEKRSLFKAGPTSLGEPYRSSAKAGAHKLVPLPSRVRIINLENGKESIIRLNDRGPFIEGRIVDVTPRVAKDLGFYEKGLARVRVEVLEVGDYPEKVHRSTSPAASTSTIIPVTEPVGPASLVPNSARTPASPGTSANSRDAISPDSPYRGTPQPSLGADTPKIPRAIPVPEVVPRASPGSL